MKKNHIPFIESCELNSQLQIQSFVQPAFLERIDSATTLPGQPSVMLQSPLMIQQQLQKDLLTPRLDTMAPWLWLVATQSSASISPLHHQIVRGRAITLTEKPELHLVWINDRVFVKQLPAYLLSHAFWTFYLDAATSPLPPDDRELLYKSAVGYIRTYHYLIQHESDFCLAREKKLIPATATFEEFANFIRGFSDISDSAVSDRYHFGDLRLTRLNFWSKFLLGKFNFEEVSGQYEAYFSRFYPPLLFAFGTFSVLLSAMQVSLNVEQLQMVEGSWRKFNNVCRWFSVATIIFVALCTIGLAGLFSYMGISELIFALCQLRPRNRKTAMTT